MRHGAPLERCWQCFERTALPEEVVLVPEAGVRARAAKVNVALKHDSLWAVHAMHEIIAHMGPEAKTNNTTTIFSVAI